MKFALSWVQLLWWSQKHVSAPFEFVFPIHTFSVCFFSFFLSFAWCFQLLRAQHRIHVYTLTHPMCVCIRLYCCYSRKKTATIRDAVIWETNRHQTITNIVPLQLYDTYRIVSYWNDHASICMVAISRHQICWIYGFYLINKRANTNANQIAQRERDHFFFHISVKEIKCESKHIFSVFVFFVRIYYS